MRSMMNMDWRKASYSINAGNCVEVGDYRKSTRSGANGQCVEVGVGRTTIGVRDTTTRDVTLTFPGDVWMKFISTLK